MTEIAATAPGTTRAAHFPLFDSFRGLGALAVFSNHAVYQPASFAGVGDWWWRWANHTDVAVPIFLGVSGFLLYRPFVRSRMITGRELSYRGYAWRRFLRIVPIYWIALTVLALIFWNDFDELRTPEGFLRFYGFAQVYSAATALQGIEQAWTLSVELTFYAVLGAWSWWMFRWRPGGERGLLRTEFVGIAGFVVIGIAWKIFALSQTSPTEQASLPWLLPLPNWIDHFAMGMLLAVLSVAVEQQPGRFRWLGFVERRPGAVWGIAFVFWLAAVYIAGPDGSTLYRAEDGTYFWRHVFYTGFVFFILLPAVFGDPEHGWVRRFLAWRPIVFFGVISYSFYLFHLHVLIQQGRWWGRIPENNLEWFVWWGAGLVVTTLLGWLGFKLVEEPAMRLKRLVPAYRKSSA